ncbi:hypothetical protein BDZ97DRAFT_767218 [Flammula alnicola]|nr:hypothetical protein BDZ97DRAFT_767218 [Flammula alnicola]
MLLIQMQASQTFSLPCLWAYAPLIASVVSSCTSGICADLTAVLGADPMTRPVRASVVIALLWCALVTSLGATMTAVAGLAMSAGYHDGHVGVTKRIVRFLRQWHASRPRSLPRHQEHEMRPPSPALSAITDMHRSQHATASFRAAVVSARLLGLSVALLAIALAIYLFLLYPMPVAISALVTGILTAAVAAAPLLPIVWPSDS